MTRINSNYLKFPGSYLFSEISRQVSGYLSENPNADIIRLGIGDVTLPVVSTVTQAMYRAIQEMSVKESFRGYGPEQGYDFLTAAVLNNEYLANGIKLEQDEIFISDGSKCDVGNIQEIFDINSRITICDPVYPVYLDSNVMAGRTGSLNADGYFEGITYLSCTKENNFAPALPQEHSDLIYLCSPNNPTGMTLNKAELEKWVHYARETGSVILYDSAYSAYITEPELPGSIYEIEGAKEVAIEFKSFSKTAGFTGLRCAFTVVPKALIRPDAYGNPVSLNMLWNRRQITKFNGVSYIVQRGAEAVYSEQGQVEINKNIDYYMNNAHIIVEGLKDADFEVYGGKNAPYIWWKLADGVKSLDFFKTLLCECQVVGTPGAGFGPCGEGYFRLTGFGDRERTLEAVQRIKENKDKLLK